MDVRNCRKCGKLFNYFMGPPVCPICKEALEVKFQEVKSYISDNQGCGIAEVAEACDISIQQIKQWLREERLEFSSDAAVGLECEACGTSIRCGRFCEACKVNMTHTLQDAYKKPAAPEVKKPQEKQNPKMRYLDR